MSELEWFNGSLIQRKDDIGVLDSDQGI